MTPIIISCISVAGAGLIIMLIAIPFFIHATHEKSRCSAQTSGEVVDYKYTRWGNWNSTIAPVVEFCVDGVTYTAYRHYKGIASAKKTSGTYKNTSEQTSGFYISDKDYFHRYNNGTRANYLMFAREKWPKESKIFVVYDPKKPEHAYVEKVVVKTGIVGSVLASVGGGLMILAAIVFFLNQ